MHARFLALVYEPYVRAVNRTAHYNDVIMGSIASLITSLTIVYSTVYSDADQRKHQSSASLAFVWGIHRGPVNSPHKWPVTRKMFPFDDVIMLSTSLHVHATDRIGDQCVWWWIKYTEKRYNKKCKLHAIIYIKHITHSTKANWKLDLESS